MSAAEKVAEASQHLEPLISDLGLILITAGIAVLLFKKLNGLFSRQITSDVQENFSTQNEAIAEP